jgi:hypothetical protein
VASQPCEADSPRNAAHGVKRPVGWRREQGRIYNDGGSIHERWKRPCGVSMTSRLKSITRTSSGHYRIELEEIGSKRTVAFDFEVDGRDGIDVVMSPPAFYDYMSQKVGPATPLLAAVGKFHQAHKIELP